MLADLRSQLHALYAAQAEAGEALAASRGAESERAAENAALQAELSAVQAAMGERDLFFWQA